MSNKTHVALYHVAWHLGSAPSCSTHTVRALDAYCPRAALSKRAALPQPYCPRARHTLSARGCTVCGRLHSPSELLCHPPTHTPTPTHPNTALQVSTPQGAPPWCSSRDLGTRRTQPHSRRADSRRAHSRGAWEAATRRRASSTRAAALPLSERLVRKAATSGRAPGTWSTNEPLTAA